MKHRSWEGVWLIVKLFMAHHARMLCLGIILATCTLLSGVALLGLSGWFITATAIVGMSMVTAPVFDIFGPSAGIRFLALLRTFSRYGERLATHDATLSILAATREKLFRGWSPPHIARQLFMRPARLLFRLTVDVDALDALYLRILVPLIAASATALGAGIAAWLVNVWVGVVFGSLLLVAGLGIPLVVANVSRNQALRRAFALEVLRARAIDLVSGQVELSLAGKLADQCDRLAQTDKRLADADDHLHRIEAATGSAFSFFSTIVLIVMLCAVALLAEKELINAPVAAFLLFLALASFEPFAALQRGALEAGRIFLSARRLAPQLVDNLPREERFAILSPSSGAAIEIKNVVLFQEGLTVPALDKINLSIPSGQTVALVGASGAGKSTLLSLIAGELQQDTGVVKRFPCAMLPQRTELFCDSVRNNLYLASPLASDNELWQALEEAGLAALIHAMPQGLDTLLGEGGGGLSQGQARRLALARLFLRSEPIWLIDEATEGLDDTTARDIIRRLYLNAARAKRTLLIATHLQREAKAADRLIVMQKGRLSRDIQRDSDEFTAVIRSMRS